MNQDCVPITKCPMTKQLNMLIQFSSNEDQKKALKEFINSMICGKPSAETVCCDNSEGKGGFFELFTFSNRIYDFQHNVLVHFVLLSECLTPSDCPNGGNNFVCHANKCECQSPKFLVADKCVGKL